EGKFSPREDRFSDLSGDDALAQLCRALLKAKYLGDAQQYAGFPCSFHHAFAFACIQAHGLLADHGFLHSIAVSTSSRWQALGVATNTASTSGLLHRVLTDVKASGMLNCFAQASAF